MRPRNSRYLSLPASRFSLLICGLALILSALLLACGGEEAVEQNGSGQGAARPAEATAEARSEEGDPTATRSTPTGAAASTPQSGTASRAASTRAAASTPRSGGAPTSEATRGSAPSTQPAVTAEPTPAPTPSGPQCPTGDPDPVAVVPSAQTSPEADKEALIALFNATDGESWDRSGSWAGRAPTGEWDGVATDDNGRVTGLVLQGIPEIPPELGNLINLRSLNLGGDQLTGEIPPELGNLINLERLNLFGDPLTGEIPPELGNLICLRSLNLGRNQLTGEIPPELGNLINLEGLNLSRNQLTGEIPPELGNLTNLESLNFFSNELSGEIPPEVGNLISLQELNLSQNQLEGCVSDFLFDRKYRRGDSSGRIASVDLPVCVTTENPDDAEALVALYASFGLTEWLGRDSPPIHEWEGVTVDASGRVVGLEIGSGDNLTQSELLEIVTELGNIANLQHLSLDVQVRNKVTIPPELGNLTNLQSLYISGDFGGEIPPELENLTNLQSLYLRGRHRGNNRLTGEIPPELGNLTNLQSLYILGGFGGEIPPELGNLTNLRYLTLTGGGSESRSVRYASTWIGMSGEIPPELGKLTNLRELNLNGRLSGCIPGSPPSGLSQEGGSVSFYCSP